jgi:hypothetical protein
MLQNAIRNSIGEGACPGNVGNAHFFGEKRPPFRYPLQGFGTHSLEEVGTIMRAGKVGTSTALAVSKIEHPWSSEPNKPLLPEIDFLRKELKLTEPQVKILNWLASVAGPAFVFQNGAHRERAFLNVVLPTQFAEHIPFVMVSLNFERTGRSSWANEWRATLADEHLVATVHLDRGEIDIRNLPYRAPQGRSKEGNKGASASEERDPSY